jgi:ornithine cyclodeaminase
MMPLDSVVPSRPPLRLFEEEEIRRVVGDEDALRSAEVAFSALGRGDALVPPPLGVDLPEVSGEVHVKGAWLRGSPTFAFKAATGFYANAASGLPTGSGLVLVFDAATGFPLAVLADNGYLTDLRTAAAGALAARLLAPATPLSVAVLGTGVQARLQLRLISGVRDVQEVHAWSPKASSRARYVDDMRRVMRVPVTAHEAATEAVAGADLVVCATPSRKPLLHPGMLGDGFTVIALGSDGPEKLELAPELLGSADKIVTDVTSQCARLGELHHAVDAGVVAPGDVHAELGEILVGLCQGREGSESIVCDLTGVGAQDAAIAAAAYSALTSQ